MKKILLTSITTVFALTIFFAVMAMASPGPAPSSGDGVSEGPGWDLDRPDGEGPGSAPNSGDGVPDGPGW